MADAISILAESREVLRCPKCRLNQFLTVSTHCRRCGGPLKPLPKKAVPETPVASAMPAAPSTVRMDLAIFAGRKALGLSQVQLGQRMNVPRTYVSKIEARGTLPTIAQTERFASALGISPRLLIEMATIQATA